MARSMFAAASAIFLISATVYAQWQPNVPVENRTLDEIYQAAQAEKCSQLRVAAGGDGTRALPPGITEQALIKAYASKGYLAGSIEGFQKRFPSIDLNLTIDFSKYHDSLIDRAFYAGNDDLYDIAALQTLQDFPRWKAQNRLLFYKPQNFSDLVNVEKDFDGAWLTVYLCRHRVVSIPSFPTLTSWYSQFRPVLLRQQQIERVRSTRQLPRPTRPQMERQANPNLPQRRRRNRLPLLPPDHQIRLRMVRAPRSAGRPMGARQRHPLHPALPGRRQQLLNPQHNLQHHAPRRLQSRSQIQGPLSRGIFIVVPNHGDLPLHQMPGVSKALRFLDLE